MSRLRHFVGRLVTIGSSLQSRYVRLGDPDFRDEKPFFESAPTHRTLGFYIADVPRFLRWVTFSLVTFPILFSLWVLRAERLPVAYPNDSGMHLQMTAFASSLFSMGTSPLDHWYPYLSLGSPFFVDYQSFSAILTGIVGHYFGVAQVYAWSLYLLLALWPLCVYWSTRLLGWSRLTAAFAAFFAPLLFSTHGHGFEYKSYLWVGNGLWSQMFAMWTLPLAWGFTWRYINSRRNFFWALLFVSLTVAFHFLTAYMAVAAIGVWVLVRPSRIVERLWRAAVLGVGVGLATAWVTLPLVIQNKWLAVNVFQVGTTINNSYGGGQVFSWLFHGDIYDAKRLPEITALVFIGAIICLAKARHDLRARAVLVMWAVSLIFFSGRPTFSFLLNLIPGSAGILFQRYISEVQLTGLVLAGIGLVGIARVVGAFVYDGLRLHESTYRQSRAATAVVLVLVTTIVLSLSSLNEMKHYAHRSAYWIARQQRADTRQGARINSLIAMAESRGGGRIYAGMPSNWGQNFTVGAVPVFIYLEQAGLDLGLPGIDAVGFTLRTSGTMTVPECYFDQSNPGDYTAFGIRWLLLPSTMRPPVRATLVARHGKFALWRSPNYGIFHVVQTSGVINATGSTIGINTSAFLRGNDIIKRVYPLLSFNGDPTPTPTLAPGEALPVNAGGYVRNQRNHLVNGEASATVTINHTSVVLLSAAFEPGWHVTVDGQPASIEILAPSLVGVKVGPGVHHVVFEWRGFPRYDVLYTISLAMFAGAGYVAWRDRRRRLTA